MKGKLVYASKKTPGYTVIFDHFGSEEYIELGELVSARSSQPKFFQNNWFIIEDREVLEFLRVAQYYPEGYSTQYLDSIFTMSPSEIAEELHHLHPSLHRTVRSIAKERIDNGSIVDIRVIRAIEVALDCVLLN